MALTRAIISKLSEVRSLEDQLNLAKRIYSSNRIGVSSKKELIINWIFEKIESHLDNFASKKSILLWKTLHVLLESEKCSSNLILLKSNCIKIILQILKNYSPHDNSFVILPCINTCLNSSSMCDLIVADGATLYSLLFASLCVMCNIFQKKPINYVALKEAKSIATMFMEVSLPFSSDVSKVIHFTNNLQEIATFMQISSEDGLFKDFTPKLCQFFCNSDDMKAFESDQDSNDPTKTVPKFNSVILRFFKKLQELLEKKVVSAEGCVAETTLIFNLMSSFFSQNLTGLRSLKFLSLMCAFAGLNVPIQITADSCCQLKFQNFIFPKQIIMPAVCKLLEACTSFPQYFNDANKTDSEYLTPLEWLKGVEAALLDVKIIIYQDQWLRCFKHLLHISPTIFENSIVSVIKVALLDIHIQNEDSKKEYCDFFIAMLRIHSQLRQLPKFFVKLLLALTECVKENCKAEILSKGQICPEVLQSIANFVREMPFGQTIELWKIYIETYTTFVKMSQVFKYSKKGALFFAAQLFSSFLLHSKFFDDSVPSNVFSKFGELIKCTFLELENNLYILEEMGPEVQPLQNSFLILSYAIGEVNVAYKACEEQSEQSPSLMLSDHPLDLSVLISFFKVEHADLFQTFLDSKNKIQSFLTFQLLLQKLKVLICNANLLEAEKKHFQLTIKTILKHIQENNLSISPWDLDVCTVNANNYGTALWRKFMAYLPLFLDFLHHKDLVVVCCLIQDISYQTTISLDKTTAKFDILSSLQSEFIQESKEMQTVFIASLWKPDNLLSKKRAFDEMDDETLIEKMFLTLSVFRSKWLKYAETTPKGCEDINHFWVNLQEASELFNQILVSDAFLHSKLQIFGVQNVIKLLKYFPVEYLLPGNQLKCIIGLSLLLIMVPFSFEYSVAFSLTKDIALLLIDILNGVRSVWLFDFVKSGPYLKAIMNSLEKMAEKEDIGTCDWVTLLINGLLNISMKFNEYVAAMEDYFSEVSKTVKSRKFSTLFMCLLLRNLSLELKYSHLKDNHKSTCLRLASVACSTITKCVKKDSVTIDSDVYILIIKCYVEIIDMAIESKHKIDEEKQNKCLELLPKVSEICFQKIFETDQNIEIYLLFISKVCSHIKELAKYVQDGFLDSSWNAVLFYLKKKSIKIKENILCSSSINIKKLLTTTTESSHEKSFNHSCPLYFINNEENSISNKNVLVSITNETTSEDNDSVLTDLSMKIKLDKNEINILKYIFTASSEAEISAIFQKLQNEMGISDISSVDVISFQIMLQVMKIIIKCVHEKSQFLVLSQLVPSFLWDLHFLIGQTCDSFVCQVMIAVPILQFANFVLEMERVLPFENVLQTLHLCAAVKPSACISHLIFIKSFNAVWNIVYTLLMKHTLQILTLKAPFILFVSKLLKSFVSSASQDVLSTCGQNVHHEMQICAQNVERLLTMAARHKIEFAKLVPYLIADYVDSVQHVTLEPTIKVHLTLGINRLIDICSENSLKMLAVNLNHSCREIYTNLVKNSKRH